MYYNCLFSKLKFIYILLSSNLFSLKLLLRLYQNLVFITVCFLWCQIPLIKFFFIRRSSSLFWRKIDKHLCSKYNLLLLCAPKKSVLMRFESNDILSYLEFTTNFIHNSATATNYCNLCNVFPWLISGRSFRV